MVWAVVALAVGNLAVLLLSGQPWGITFAFALWGAKILQAVGVDMAQFEYWTWSYPAAALRDSVLVAAALGGLLMGYGARLAFGCNIGAMFSGIASASLHGWIWFAAAWMGSLLAIRLRPWFGLSNQ